MTPFLGAMGGLGRQLAGSATIRESRNMSAEFPPEITEPPKSPPPWWRGLVVVGFFMGLAVVQFFLTTDHRKGYGWLLVGFLLLGLSYIAWQIRRHHRPTRGPTSNGTR